MKIMDCTLRDGGYCNNWKWREEEIKEIVEALQESKVDLIEVGYRRHDDGNDFYTKDDRLYEILGREYDNLCLMIDFKNYLTDGKLQSKKLLDDFLEDSQYKYVRVAIEYKDLGAAKYACNLLAALGYKVFMSIMKISMFNSKELESIVDSINFARFDIIGLYIADSFGNINNIERIGSSFDSGFHTHNNRNLSISHYINDEVDYFDTSIMGLGRGAGNCDTISALIERDNQIHENLYYVAEKIIKPLKEQNKVGYSYAYHYAGKNNIHPFYISELKKTIDNEYGIVNILQTIPEDKKTSYDKGLLCQ